MVEGLNPATAHLLNGGIRWAEPIDVGESKPPPSQRGLADIRESTEGEAQRIASALLSGESRTHANSNRQKFFH